MTPFVAWHAVLQAAITVPFALQAVAVSSIKADLQAQLGTDSPNPGTTEPSSPGTDAVSGLATLAASLFDCASRKS